MDKLHAYSRVVINERRENNPVKSTPTGHKPPKPILISKKTRAKFRPNEEILPHKHLDKLRVQANGIGYEAAKAAYDLSQCYKNANTEKKYGLKTNKRQKRESFWLKVAELKLSEIPDEQIASREENLKATIKERQDKKDNNPGKNWFKRYMASSTAVGASAGVLGALAAAGPVGLAIGTTGVLVGVGSLIGSTAYAMWRQEGIDMAEQAAMAHVANSKQAEQTEENIDLDVSETSLTNSKQPGQTDQYIDLDISEESLPVN